MSVNSFNNYFIPPQQIEDYLADSSPIPKVLDKRMDKIIGQAFNGMIEMGIPEETAFSVVVNFNIQNITPDPAAKKTAEGISIEIPLLFLISAKDKKPNSPVGTWFKEHLQKSTLNQKDLVNLQVFDIFLREATLAKQAKKFVLYHELAHILNDDVSSPKVSPSESRKREVKADLTSAQYSGAVDGGIYLFEIMSKFSPKSKNSESDSHPSFSERVTYLKTSGWH